MLGPVRRLRAVIGLGLNQLRHDRMRSILAVIGIALAVIATTMLASVGYGVIQTGEEKFEESGRDLWVTGGPTRISPGSVGGFDNTILDSHAISNNISRLDGVASAVPIAFQTVYVGTAPDELDTHIAVGVKHAGSSGISVSEGEPFSGPDVHYAGGSYDGPMTREVIIDQRTANTFNLTLNDTLYIGGTIANARANEFTVTGRSPTFSEFLGTPTVTLRLSELQELTGTTRTDRATMISVNVKDSSDAEQVKGHIEEMYPELSVRTNREQLQSMLQDQMVVIASGVTLVILAVIAGLALTVNLMALLVYQQRQELAAAKAVGVSSWTLMGITGVQGVFLGVGGGLLGLGLTPPAANLVNYVARSIVGFEGLVRTPEVVYIGAGIMALSMGILGSLVAGWRIARIQPADQLRN